MSDGGVAHESANVEWIKYVLGGLAAAMTLSLTAIANWVRGMNEERKAEIAAQALGSASAIQAVADEAIRSIREVAKESEDGRRRIWERINVMDQAGHDARLDDSRRYVTKADLETQTARIEELIRDRKPVRAVSRHD